MQTKRKPDAPALIPEIPGTGNDAGFFTLDGRARRASTPEREALRHRLVEASKSPTGLLEGSMIGSAEFAARLSDLKATHKYNLSVVAESGEKLEPEYYDEVEPVRRQKTPHGQAGCKTVYEYREWEDAYRIRTEVAPTAGNQPPEQVERISKYLSTRGARKIAESCEYMALKKGGYKTFVTGTFSGESRYALYEGEDWKQNCSDVGPVQGLCGPMPFKAATTTVQKEVTRTMDAMQKLYQRGFLDGEGNRVEVHRGRYRADVPELAQGELVIAKVKAKASGQFTPIYIDSSGRVAPEQRSGLAGAEVEIGCITNDGPCSRLIKQAQKLAYCWVVEIPKNARGEDNPHIHMLLGWRVEYEHFGQWAERIESIWGNGHFHLEKIKDILCAGSYMAKAAGYLSKAQGSDDQGEVTGNRYGISSEARAPGWVTIGEDQLHIMGQLIADVYDHLTLVHGDKYRKRKRLNEALEKTPKSDRSEREKIGKALQKVREEIKAVPVRCNKYQVILKGKGNFNMFCHWAQVEDAAKPDWLPEKPEGEVFKPGASPHARDSHYFRGIRRKFQEMKKRRHAVTDQIGAAIVAFVDECKSWAMDMGAWNEYEAMAL